MSNRMQELIERGLLVLGEGVVIEDFVVLCQQEETNEGPGYPVVIGSNTRIRSGAVLYEGVHIGSDCRIGHGAILRSHATVGNHVVLSHHVIVEHDSKLGDWVRCSPHTHITSNVVLEDRVFLGAGVVTVNDKFLTWKRNDIQPSLKPPYFEFGARVGSGSTILSGVRVGRLAIVGAGSLVTHDVPPYKMAFGNPARIRGDVPELQRTPNGPDKENQIAEVRNEN